MFAIIKTGGKQISVKVGDEIFVEKLPVEEGKKVTFNEVLMIDGTVGSPLIKGAAVTGTVVKQGKEKKLRVVRYHPKKNVNKIYGHRQPYTKVKIDNISASGANASSTSSSEKTAVATKPATTAKPATTKPATAAKTTAAKPATTKPAAKTTENKGE